MRAELDNYFKDITFVDSATHTAASLIAFGDDVNNQFKDKGYLYFKNQSQNGAGYLVYSIDTTINVHKIGFSESPKDKNLLLEGLIYTIRNVAASLGRKLVLNDIDADVEQFIRDRNDKLKKQKIEEIYWWKLIV